MGNPTFVPDVIIKVMNNITLDGRIYPLINGGLGSGNFGHSGRPGKVGGSGKGGLAINKLSSEHQEIVKEVAKRAAVLAGRLSRGQGVDSLDPERTEIQRTLSLIRAEAFKQAKIPDFAVDSGLWEWSKGNGPRDKNGKYLDTPDLEKYKDRIPETFDRALVQSIYQAMGISEITVYRGQDPQFAEPKTGYTSYSYSKSFVENFGSKIIEKKIPVSKIVADDTIFRFSRYSEEQELIVDL